MAFALADHWVWDFWFATEHDRVHLFFLHAPRSLGDPELRHQAARIGHATSTDLLEWTVLPRPLPDPPPGAPDDRATWTGSVVPADDGLWHMFYTGVSSREDGQVQRVLSATSPDLETWTRTDVMVEADPRFYEQWTAELPELHWRDPWLHHDQETGLWRMYVTARAPSGPLDGRGVVATATSADLRHWAVEPPLTTPGELRQLEVTQLVRVADRWALLFCAGASDHSAARLARDNVVPESGTHALYGPSPAGPFVAESDRFLVAGEPHLYAGRVLDWRGMTHFLGWRPGPVGGPFDGSISDPLPLLQTRDGTLVVERPPTAPDLAPLDVAAEP